MYHDLYSHPGPQFGIGSRFSRSKEGKYLFSLDIASLGPTLIFLKERDRFFFFFHICIDYFHDKRLKLFGIPRAKPILWLFYNGPKPIPYDKSNNWFYFPFWAYRALAVKQVNILGVLDKYFSGIIDTQASCPTVHPIGNKPIPELIKFRISVVYSGTWEFSIFLLCLYQYVNAVSSHGWNGHKNQQHPGNNSTSNVLIWINEENH